jgi:hypothetical protein
MYQWHVLQAVDTEDVVSGAFYIRWKEPGNAFDVISNGLPCLIEPSRSPLPKGPGAELLGFGAAALHTTPLVEAQRRSHAFQEAQTWGRLARDFLAPPGGPQINWAASPAQSDVFRKNIYLWINEIQ